MDDVPQFTKCLAMVTRRCHRTLGLSSDQAYPHAQISLLRNWPDRYTAWVHYQTDPDADLKFANSHILIPDNVEGLLFSAPSQIETYPNE